MATTKRTHSGSTHTTSHVKNADSEHANSMHGKSTGTRGGSHEQHVEAGRKGGLAAHSSRGRQKGSASSEGHSPSTNGIHSKHGKSKADSE